MAEEYRHFTNMRTPFDAGSLRFLESLVDYVVGDPVPAVHGSALPLAELKKQGIVGIYIKVGEMYKARAG